MYLTIRNLPNNLKIILTDHFFILISAAGFMYYKLSYKDMLFYKSALYCFNLNYKSYYTFKKLMQRSLVCNCSGFLQCMRLTGIGFKVVYESDCLIFRLGYCNAIKVRLPFGISAKCLSKIDFVIFSFDLNLLMSFCTYILRLRTRNVYKASGIYYLNEIVILKRKKAKKETV